MHRLAYNEMIQKQSDISARLADINQHFAERIKVEILETLDIVQKINAATLPLDKVKLYQDWLKFFSQRRMEDVNYAMEAAQVLSSTEMKLSMGLVDKEDLQAAKAA
jgi:dTDP-D-glucose 4,6-dehydratase